MDIAREYTLLFNAITDAEQTLSELRERLMSAQQVAEEIYIQNENEKDDQG